MDLNSELRLQTEYIAPHEPQPHTESTTFHAHKRPTPDDTLGGLIRENTKQSNFCAWKCEQCRVAGTEVSSLTFSEFQSAD
jgi:hypothetical protein